MKRLLVVGTVLLLACFMAVPAMAMQITFTFSGEVSGGFDGGADFNGAYTFTAISDTSKLTSGSFINSITGDPFSVNYYANPDVTGVLSLNGVDGTGAVVSINETILDPLYIAYDILTGDLALGIWDVGILADGDSPFIGDLVTAFGIGNFDMLSDLGPVTTPDYLAGGQVNVASGLFIFDDTAAGSESGSMTYSVHVPEPSMLLLFGTGLVGLGLLRRKI